MVHADELLEPAAAKTSLLGLSERTVMLSVAVSLRRIADHLERRENVTIDLPPIPAAVAQQISAAIQAAGELDASADSDDQRAGRDMIAAIEMMHHSGRYLEYIERQRMIASDEFGLTATLPFLATIFKRAEGTVERQLLSVAGVSRMIEPGNVRRFFVPTAHASA